MAELKRTFSDLLIWLQASPPGTLVPVLAIVQALASAEPDVQPPAAREHQSWRERLWTCDPQTRIGCVELAEAVGRSKSWVYRCTSRKAKGPRIPHRLLQGELIFIVGEIRDGVTEQEMVVGSGRSAGCAVHRRPSTPTP